MSEVMAMSRRESHRDMSECHAVSHTVRHTHPDPYPTRLLLTTFVVRLCRGPKERALASETRTPTPCTELQTQARFVRYDRARGALADGGTR